MAESQPLQKPVASASSSPVNLGDHLDAVGERPRAVQKSKVVD
jgi:hypothetical protein